MIFGRKASQNEKVFVNYRRDDAGGYAGRLSDTLSQYFGADRVFRDVTGISYGHDFETVIDDQLAESGALIVLIGDRWADISDEAGNRRLDDPGDYVTREISVALEKGMPVLPVLIGDARMPQAERLPDKLKELVRRNAMTITDERWDHDVDRLAKVIAIDVPGSVAQRRLDMLKVLSLVLLFVAGAITTLGFCAALAGSMDSLSGLRAAGFTPLMASVGFMAILTAGTLTIIAVPDMELSKRKYGVAAVLLAGFGAFGAFLHYVLTNNQTPIWSLVVSYGAGMIVICGLLALIGLAGFRAK